jgi:hypothetical protein
MLGYGPCWKHSDLWNGGLPSAERATARGSDPSRRCATLEGKAPAAPRNHRRGAPGHDRYPCTGIHAPVLG